LTDEARVVRLVATGERVEGRTPTEPVHGDWMAARLVPGEEREREERGVRTVLHRAQIVLLAGADVRPSDRLEIRSRTFGDATWSVVANPQTVASRRRSRAVIVAVERVSEPVRDEVGVTP